MVILFSNSSVVKILEKVMLDVALNNGVNGFVVSNIVLLREVYMLVIKFL